MPVQIPVSRHRLAPLLAASLLGLTACAQLGSTAEPAPPHPIATALPAGWSPATGQAPAALDLPALTAWWRQFDDPLLSALIDEALQANTSIQQARASLAQVRALRAQQAALGSPQLGSSAGITRSRSQQVGSTLYDAGLDASWEPDFFGSQAAAVRAREADISASAADLATVQMSISAEVGLAYLQLRGGYQGLRIARENLAAQQDTEALVGWRAQAGLASSLEAEQARLSVQQLRAAIPAQEASLRKTEFQIAVLLGQPPASLHERLGHSDRLPAAAPDLPTGVPADVLRLRPDVRAAEASIRAETERLRSSQAERWPSFSISGSLALKAATLGGLSAANAVVSAAAAAVSWPLWDGGSRQGKIDAQQAVLDQSRASYQAAVLTALQDVENALASLDATRTQLQALQLADEAARNALLLARQRYQAGLVDFSVLLDAQRSALTAQSSLASAQTDLGLNLIRLYKALGGGWSASA
jgi:multidrug efflux system outer membrane protein